MERINQYDLYTLGQEFAALRRFNPNDDVSCSAAFHPLMEARGAIRGLLKGKPTPLGVSKAPAEALHDLLDRLWNGNYISKDENGKESLKFPDSTTPPIHSWDWQWLLQCLDRFETVFQEDMREAAAYVVPRRGIYYTPALVDHADTTFPEQIAAYIPEKAKMDFRAAGRCLAFNLLTASGYHIARAVEGMVEVYYQYHCGKGTDETLTGWRAYVDALNAVLQASHPVGLTEKTLKELDQMREDYRNPLAHPRVVLDEAEARVVFSNGESLIISMAEELKAAAAAKASTSGAAATLTLLGGLAAVASE